MNENNRELSLHETQHLLHDYDHLEPDPDYTGTIGDYLESEKEFLQNENQTCRQLNIKVGAGPQGTKWRVKWKRNRARLDQIEQVKYELEQRGKLANSFEG